MSRDSGVSTALIAFTVTIGVLALITPLVLRVLIDPAPRAEAAAGPSAKVRVVKRLDLDSVGLAHPGGCGVGEFKDGRKISASIRLQLRSAGLGELGVRVTPRCWALLEGRVRTEQEAERAVKAASHPWIAIVDYRRLEVAAGSAEPPPVER